ncbi:(2Fe-2S)-binding protein [Streptomyces sp. B93]|nr:(2Fe-2S)-binding protein [Streptomyces sp. B93]
MPYDFGANSRLLSETDRSFNTGSMRVTVLRDLLGVTGPKYGRGINVCKACTSHLDSRAVNPCAVPVGDLRPMRQAWLDRDVAHCGYCRPGQIMAAVALVRRVAEEGRALTDADLDGIGSICRCGTYLRIREAIREGAGNT